MAGFASAAVGSLHEATHPFDQFYDSLPAFLLACSYWRDLHFDVVAAAFHEKCTHGMNHGREIGGRQSQCTNDMTHE